MDLTALQYFVEAYEQKNMTVAAERLFVTRQAVSKSIRQLESTFGVKLFLPRRGGIDATPAGDCLYRHARMLLSDYNALSRDMEALGPSRGKALRIGFGKMTFNLFIDSVHSYQLAHPEIELITEVMPPDGLRDLLAAGAIDAAISTSRIALPDMTERVLQHRPLYMLMRADDPLAREEALEPSMLCGRTVLAPPETPAFLKDFSDYAAREKLQLSCAFCPQSDIISVLQHIEKTRGLFLTSGNFLRFFHLQSDFVMKELHGSSLMPDKSVRVYIVRPSENLTRLLCHLRDCTA